MPHRNHPASGGLLLLLATGLLLCLTGPALAAPATDSNRASENQPGSNQAGSDQAGSDQAGSDRPNILWITAEDMSPTLGCYGDDYAHTPNIDRLATESVKYSHAFATAPVCSPARSCLITGCYAPSLGTQNMRSAFPLPEKIRGFPALLREAGWFTTNNAKTDYNTSSWKRLVEESWNESSNTAHWRKRPDEEPHRPFFSVFNLMTSHQSRSMVWPRERFVEEVQSRLEPDGIHDPDEAPLPPYYPDTPVVRRTVARYYDCVTAMDKEVGRLLQQLEDDGLADDTIVFFYSDHGSGMPRHKRALLDSGMHVPLLIRFPEKYRHLAPAAPGDTTDRLVSFVDFAPTVLNLAGIDLPEYLQGRPFLGPDQADPRKYVYGHRDRVDEAIDVARSVRDGRYLYIRNYMPHLSYNQPTAWPDQGAIRHEFYRLADPEHPDHPEQLTDAQWHFAGPVRPIEELYDCENDPLNLNNLAGSSEHAETLERLREAHRDHVTETKDVGFVPEPIAWKLCGDAAPWNVARGVEQPDQPGSLGAYVRAFKAASMTARTPEPELIEQLHAVGESVRYWAAVALAGKSSVADQELSSSAWHELTEALQDPSPTVRIAAADALARHGHTDHAVPVLIDLLKHEDLTTVLYAARTVELLGERAAAAVPVMSEVLKRTEQLRPSGAGATFVLSGEQDLAMFIGFSANAFLSRVSPDASPGSQDDEDDADTGSQPAETGSQRGDSGQASAEEGWIRLFDGESLEDWTARAAGEVEAVDGEIRILSRGKNLWLVHEHEFADFELEVEALMPESGYNSGIGFRCSGEGKPKGYQCEVANEKSGMIYAIGSGWVWPRGQEEQARFREMAGDCFKIGKWNHFRIRCEGPHIVIQVNGVKTADVKDDRFRKGSVALQHHGKGDVHRFRNIRLRALKTNGSD